MAPASHNFPRWPIVYHYFRAWRIDGTWERINRAIRERLRVRLNRDPQPSAGVVDSQGRSRVAQRSAVTIDGGKKVMGRKRHLLVDTEGFVLKAKVHSAKMMDFERGLRPYCGRQIRNFPACVICGWTLATAGRTRAQTGYRRCWVGVWISSSASARLPPKRT